MILIAGRRSRAAGNGLLMGAAVLLSVETRDSFVAVAQPPSLREIVEMRSIDSLLPSPDGRLVAFRLISPSVAKNRNSVRWFATTIATGLTRPLGRETEATYDPIFDSVTTAVAQWSTDSRTLYVRQLDGSEVQIDALPLTGGDRQVTHDRADVVSFRIEGGGSRIRYQVRADRDSIASAQLNEARDGIRLDRTVITDGMPLTGNFVIGHRRTTVRRYLGEAATEAYAGPLREHSVAIAPIADRTIAAREASLRWPMIGVGDDLAVTSMVPFGIHGGKALRVIVRPPDSKLLEAVVQVRAALPDGREVACAADICSGLSPSIRLITSGSDGEIVIAVEKDFSALTGLYSWSPLSGQVRTMIAPTASLDGGSVGSTCGRGADELLCVQASATRPPRLVKIDLRNGHIVPLFDPNIDLAQRDYGISRFLSWTDEQGRAANGVLLLPHGAKQPLPLVVTTYRCRGFLRGGTGMVAPEHILVARGFATLCVNNNDRSMFAEDFTETHEPLSMQRASLAAYQSGVRLLSAQGLVDPTRVGIAGHSYSAMVVAYGISHSQTFAAAVIGTGINIDPNSYPLAAPTADSWRKGYLDALNLPRPDEDPTGLWGKVSPALNAKAVTAPLLIEPAESEYTSALQLFAYLQDAGKTVEMYIYPGAAHLFGRYPVQQLTRSDRAISWFQRWLEPPSQTPGDR